MISLYHHHKIFPNQCSSSLVQTIDAPLPLVWSMVRCFDNPQTYKRFIKSCTIQAGDGGTGRVREIKVMSRLLAQLSIERLDKLDDDRHAMMVNIISGDHRLLNYKSTTTLHMDDRENGDGKTVVIESYVVDVLEGNSKEDTCLFADTIIRCNLKSLANISERMACELQG
ncbi:abscisic acid receptor PYL12-like [Camellia sinensis]|nr:abscisic acid receptor PYL12-like [Camellia sinensis]